MSLVSLKPWIDAGHQAGFAVPLFCVPSLTTAIGVVRAAEAEKAPIIFGMYNDWFKHKDYGAICAGMRDLAATASVPVGLMLDHGSSFEMCVKALRHGFTDLMFDGSALPFAENAAITRQICDCAHPLGVSVEAELGHVGHGSDYDADEARSHYTQPESLAEFAQISGADVMAVAFGTAHGDYKSTPKLDLALLERLEAASPVPLAMHGGSGLSEDQFHGAISRGICKINVGTHLFHEAAGKVKAHIESGAKPDLFAIEDGIRDAFDETCRYYIRLFGASGKA